MVKKRIIKNSNIIIENIKNVLFLILFIPCFIHAKSYNYDNTIPRANQYISTFKDYTDYLKVESMPYNYEDGENKKM